MVNVAASESGGPRDSSAMAALLVLSAHMATDATRVASAQSGFRHTSHAKLHFFRAELLEQAPFATFLAQFIGLTVL